MKYNLETLKGTIIMGGVESLVIKYNAHLDGKNYFEGMTIQHFFQHLYIQSSSVRMSVCLYVTFYVTWSIVNNSAIWGPFGDIEVSTKL